MDDKIVVASGNEIRLWDFYDHKEEAPELITAMQLSDEDDFSVIEKLYINKNGRCTAPDSVKTLLVLAVCQNKFILYSGRLVV